MDWDAGAIWEADYGARTLVCLDFWCGPEMGLGGFETASRKQNIAMGSGLPGLAWAGGEPVWEVVARYLRARKTVPPLRPNVPLLKGVGGDRGLGSLDASG